MKFNADSSRVLDYLLDYLLKSIKSGSLMLTVDVITSHAT